MTGQKPGREFIFDTCVEIRMCQNPNIASLLACRIDLKDSTVHLNSQISTELTKSCYDVESISRQIESLGAHVKRKSITSQMKDRAIILESQCPTLHRGDSCILAYAEMTKITLVTSDRGLAQAAKLIGVGVINPDLLPCDVSAKKVKTRFHNIVIRLPPVVKKKASKSISLKPGHRITWSAFN